MTLQVLKAGKALHCLLLQVSVGHLRKAEQAGAGRGRQDWGMSVRGGRPARGAAPIDAAGQTPLQSCIYRGTNTGLLTGCLTSTHFLPCAFSRWLIT